MPDSGDARSRACVGLIVQAPNQPELGVRTGRTLLPEESGSETSDERP